MSTIRHARFPDDLEQVQNLFTELGQFIFDNILLRFGVGFDVHAKVAEWTAHMEEFSSPKGHLALASANSEIVAVGGLRTIGELVGEIKHVYVCPPFRGRGRGRGLLGHLGEQSVCMGHIVLRRDTAWFMVAAQALYRALGFREVSPYPESEVPTELHAFWVFMAKDLTALAHDRL